jgi:HSP20 family protein
MRLVRWRPQAGLAPVHDEFERMFDSFFGIDRRRSDLESFDWVPRVNVEELEDRFEISAEIPGMKKDDIGIEIQENVLTIKGEKKYEKEEKDRNYTIFERSYGTFRRAFTLPENVNGERIDASYGDGVLTITVPKIEPVRPKEIKVKVK